MNTQCKSKPCQHSAHKQKLGGEQTLVPASTRWSAHAREAAVETAFHGKNLVLRVSPRVQF